MSLKKGQIYEGMVTEYRFPDKGITEAEGQLVGVKGALPGQKVSFSVSRKRSAGLSDGRLLEVLERSPLETQEPMCPHFGRCGGCSYQRLSYKDQAALKADTVERLIRTVYPDICFEEIVSSPDAERYRNKMEFTFGDEFKGGPFALGLHSKGSFHDILNLSDCRLVHEDMNVIRNTVRDYFNEYYVEGRVDFHHKMTHRGYLRHLLIRRSVFNKEILVALVTTTPDLCDCMDEGSEHDILMKLTEKLISLEKDGVLEGRIAGVCHVYNNALSDVVHSDRTEILYGRDHIIESILGLKFRISLFSFFQTNSKGCEKLYEKAREFASYDGGGVIYDLYSGTGTIAQLMSPAASEVIGIEIVKDAVESARENAALNEIGNVSFISGDVMKVLCGNEGEELPHPDLIILDPPREGIHPKALGRILGFGVDKIIYISCKPTSLANDLAAFKQAGYELNRAVCVDMFPQTVHVETVCLLSKLKSTQHMNYNKPKSEDAKQPQCPPDKEKAIKEALQHFGMI